MSGFLTSENWIRDLPARVRDAVESKMETFDLPAGTVCKQAGDPPDGLFQVADGFLRLQGLHRNGQQILILLYREGNTFGETPMVARRGFNHTTIALTDARMKKVSLQDFWELYRAHPEIPESLCRKFAHNISRGFVRRELRATHNLRGQIEATFVNIAQACGKPDDEEHVTFVLPITQNDIAEHLEVTRQAVQREMSAMSDRGILTKQGGVWRMKRTLLNSV